MKHQKILFGLSVIYLMMERQRTETIMKMKDQKTKENETPKNSWNTKKVHETPKKFMKRQKSSWNAKQEGYESHVCTKIHSRTVIHIDKTWYVVNVHGNGNSYFRPHNPQSV